MSCDNRQKETSTKLSSICGTPPRHAALAPQAFADDWTVENLVCEAEENRGEPFLNYTIGTNPNGEQYIFGHTKDSDVTVAYLGTNSLNIGHVDAIVREMDRQGIPVDGNAESCEMLWSRLQRKAKNPTDLVYSVLEAVCDDRVGWSTYVAPISRALFSQSQDRGVEQAAFALNGRLSALSPDKEQLEAIAAVDAYSRGEGDNTDIEVLTGIVEATRDVDDAELQGVRRRALEILQENGQLWLLRNGRDVKVNDFVENMK